MNTASLLYRRPAPAEAPALPVVAVADPTPPPLPDIPGASSLSWQVAPPGFTLETGGWWQLIIDGMPMAKDYVQPQSERYTFRPGCGGGNIWAHLERLADIAARASTIVEIGIATCTGSTHAFDEGLKVSPAPYKRHIGVDIHPVANPAWAPKAEWWSYVKGDSREAATVARVQALLTLPATDGYPGDFLAPDIIYIDTVHEYEFLAAELGNWEPLASDATLWLFHDTYLNGPEHRHHLTDAIEEFAAKHADRWRYVSLSEKCSGIGALVPLKGGIL
jgi:hypothetical protein